MKETPSQRHSRQTAERAQRREAYLDAALAVIRADGPTASMASIAAAAGVSKPILYRHFGDRDGLVDALVDRFATILVGLLEDAFAEPSEPLDMLRATVSAYLELIEDDPGLYRFLTQHAAPAGGSMGHLVDRVAATITRELGERLRDAGVDSGPAEPWAYGIVGLVNFAGDRWAAHPTMPRQRLVDELVRLLWQGLAGAVAGPGANGASPP